MDENKQSEIKPPASELPVDQSVREPAQLSPQHLEIDSSSPETANTFGERPIAEDQIRCDITIDQKKENVWGLTSADRRFVLCSCVIIIALTLFHLVRLNVTSEPTILIDRGAKTELFQIQMNQASWVEWMQLPDIGEVTARLIVEDRKTHGPFLSVSDVQRVKGIGPKTMEKIRPHLKVE